MTDRKQTEQFLSHFDHKIYTFQFLKKGKPAGYYTCASPLTDKDWEYLKEQHEKHKKEVFLLINEGDGEIKPGKKIPRSQENVIALDSLFIDTDEVPFSEVKAFLQAHQIKPHLIVATSPGRYHLYIFLDKIRPEDMPPQKWRQAIRQWKQLQQSLAHLGKPQAQADKSMMDESRVLRVPGFHHLKNPEAPFPCEIVKVYQHQRYSLDEIQSLLGQDLILQETPAQSQNGIHKSYQLPTSKVGEGNRHHELMRFLGSILSKGVDPEIARLACTQFITEHFEQSATFLTGDRKAEIDKAIEWKLGELEKENQAAKREACEFAIENGQKPAAHKFDLPQNFYLKAPSFLGEVLNEIESTARYVLPESSLCGALSLLALAKGERFRLHKVGSPPCLYICFFGPTGSGKNNSKLFLRQSASEIGLDDQLVSGIRGGTGLLMDLQRSQSALSVILDEARHFLSSHSNKDAQSHERTAATHLLQLYSDYDSPSVNLGSATTRGAENITLEYPHLNILCFGTNDVLQDAFTKQSVASGFLQRFIVVSSHVVKKIKNQNRKDFNLPSNIRKILQSFQAFPGDEQVRRVHKFESPAVFKRLEEFQDEMDRRWEDEVNNNKSGLEGIYSRAFEQVGRMCCCMAVDKVTMEMADFAIAFIESRTEALIAACSEEFNTPTYAKELDELEQFVLNNRNNENWCTYRKIIHGFKVRDADKLKKLLALGVEANRLEVNYKYRKGDSKGKAGTAYTVNTEDLSHLIAT